MPVLNTSKVFVNSGIFLPRFLRDEVNQKIQKDGLPKNLSLMMLCTAYVTGDLSFKLRKDKQVQKRNTYTNRTLLSDLHIDIVDREGNIVNPTQMHRTLEGYEVPEREAERVEQRMDKAVEDTFKVLREKGINVDDLDPDTIRGILSELL